MKKVVFPLRQRMKRPEVADLQDALQVLLDRGAILAEDHDARAEMADGLARERAETTFGRVTKKLVTLFQEPRRIEPSGEVDEPTADAINGMLDEWGLLGRPSGQPSRVVSGRVVSHELRGLAGMQVVAVDKNVGRDERLGAATSLEGGRYEIRYAFESSRKKHPDVQVRITDADGSVLASSPVRYDASPEENGLNIVLTADALPAESEYRRLTADLGAQLGNPSGRRLTEQLGALREDEKQQDITYLANKTGWDARMVAMTSLASQFGERSDIEPEFYYALFRGGVPANEEVLDQMSPEAVEQAWEHALEQNVLPQELRNRIPDALKKFKARSAERILDAPAGVGVSGFRELIGRAVEDSALQQRVARLYYDHREDLDTFWEKAGQEIGEDAAAALELDGRLAFLTINNAPLIGRLHGEVQEEPSPLALVRGGFYEKGAWERLLSNGIPIPEEIPGDSRQEKVSNYADLMASQLQLSHPTAVVTEMIRADSMPLRASAEVKSAVTDFLDKNEGSFELGVQPVQQYLEKNELRLEDEVLTQVRMLQRVFQISPSNEAMGTLLEHDLHSAHAVSRFSEGDFVRTFSKELGGDTTAKLIHAKANQVHNTVLNIVTAYVLEKSAPEVFSISKLAAFENGTGNGAAAAAGVIAYPTLEEMFGEMDYCACRHCRSWLSPAAYLVDLLEFCDPPAHDKDNPLDVLLGRRPDLQHLQLTCENTNTVLPYIDLVNEILEHWVVNGSLATYSGHNIEEGVTTEELLATAQFVNDAAYSELRSFVFPPPLPFHQSLEALRLYFDNFEMPLHEAMERLRTDDDLERPGNEADLQYGWRDILMERLQLSRPEHEVLTDGSIALQALYGDDPAIVSTAQLVDTLSNAKSFSRRVDISYEELIEITRTRFVNPHSHLIPKLERLGVDFKVVQDYLDGVIDDEAFKGLVPLDELDMPQYGGSNDQTDDQKVAQLKQWLLGHRDQIMGLIVLADPTGSGDLCSFDHIELRYALPDFANNQLKPAEFLKLLRFIRLWRKTGWSIEQVDLALAALYPAGQVPTPGDDFAAAATKLDAGFKIFLMRLAHVNAAMELLRLKPKRDLAALLACWSEIDTHGHRSLYRQMLLNPASLSENEVFQEDGHGAYLQDPTKKLVDHASALRAAFSLTQDEFDLILAELQFNANTVLSLANVSAVFRHGYLARKLRISVQELIALKSMTGLDPFSPLDLAHPPDPAQPLGAVRPDALRFIEQAQSIKDSPFKISQLLYFLRHQDLSGKASPSRDSVLTFARTLREDMLRVESEHVVEDDPGGEIAKSKIALVYGEEAAGVFFGLLNSTSEFSVTYHHGQPGLEADLLAVTDRIAYDDFRKELSFRGLMTAAEKAALDGAASATAAFSTAVQALLDDGQRTFDDFFGRYPELEGLYESFVNSSDPLTERLSALLVSVLPELRARLKRQQVRQTVSAQVDADLTVVTPLLEDERLLHSVADAAEPAIADFLALESRGLSSEIFFADDVTGPVDLTLAPAEVDYQDSGADLPPNPAGGNSKISGVWEGFLQPADNGFYNFYLSADAGADVALDLDGEPVALVLNNGVWENQDPIELEVGRLVELRLVAKKIKDRLVLEWERKGMGREIVPPEQLYPTTAVEGFTASYLRLVKALAIADELSLSTMELEHFAMHDDYGIAGDGWLNALPVASPPAGGVLQELMANLAALLDYAKRKEELKVRDDRLVEVLQDPAATGEDGQPLLSRVTGWPESDRNSLLGHFGLTLPDLSHLSHFSRVQRAFEVVEKLGIGAAALLTGTTNEPSADIRRALEAALRARYDESAWLKVIQPINDRLRGLQRDALVAYVLHRLKQDPATEHIDTADKLFEYFLIDVLMEPCMKTSRIKQALSTVQLFVQRCLLNLEPQVAPSSIDGEQWKWMKRYRVWEANRKVFLWPENWLEPELRDNKSPFFKDLESELLQGDITEEAAATALVNYLEKLDDVAKLEISGMFLEENQTESEADDVVHVVARTSGARRNYYYRRQDGRTSWWPWEKVDLNIEDDPVLPVVWKGRLFLFWVSIIQESPPDQGESQSSGSLDMTSVTPSQLKGVAGEPRTRVRAALYWSEYVHRQWQPPRTSEVSRSLRLGDFNAGDFDRTKIRLASSENRDGDLFVSVSYDGSEDRHYKLFNANSVPVRKRKYLHQLDVPTPVRGRGFSRKSSPFTVSYRDSSASGDNWNFDQKVLKSGELYEVMGPRHPLARLFDSPFFFQDRQHVFFVEPARSLVTVGGSLDIGVWKPPQDLVIDLPVLVEPEIIIPPEDFLLPPDLIRPGVVDPSPVESFLGRDRYVHRVMGTTGTVAFGGRVIGPGGSMTIENRFI